MGQAYVAPTSDNSSSSGTVGGPAIQVRMRGTYSGANYYWWSCDGTPDTTGRWWTSPGGVAFASLTGVVVMGG